MNFETIKNVAFKTGRIAGASGSLILVGATTSIVAAGTILLAKEAITGRFENLVAAIRS